MNILKTDLAPIPEKAWKQINEEAERTLRSNLSARNLVDVVGPKGFDFSAVSEGRIDSPDGKSKDKVGYGIRKVKPLVELRATFELDLWELDNAERGARDLNLTDLTEAAKRIAGFEETVIYNGFEAAGIVGMAEAGRSKNKPVPLGRDVTKFQDAIVQAKLTLEDQEVEGPYALVLGTEPYRILYGTASGYPAWKQVEHWIGEQVYMSPFIQGGFLVSRRGGDLEMVLGQDLAIGYEGVNDKKVRLYFTESFTFRALHPKVIAELAFRPER